MALRPVNPTRVWLRHVKRADTGTMVVHATFAAQLLEGVNGRNGWQTGEATAQLADDGSVTVTFPNAPGDDGVRHLDRFAILADGSYVPGEEWIEVMREPHEPSAVFTPTAAKRTRQQIEISGYDVAGFMARLRASEVDLWAHSPRDVFEHYTRLPYLAAGRVLSSGWTGTGVSGTDTGWDFTNITATGGAAAFSVTTGEATISRGSMAGGDGACWTAHTRARVTEIGDGTDGGIALRISNTAAGLLAEMQVHADGHGWVQGGLRAGPIDLPAHLTVTWPAAIDLEIVCRYDRLFFFANGQLLGAQKRDTRYPPPDLLTVAAVAGTGATVALAGTFEVAHLEAHAPFALRGLDKGDRWLPGLPTPGGLRARWLNEAANATANGAGSAAFLAEALTPLAEPANSTLEPTLDKPSGFIPQGLPGEWSVLLTGAIRLDLQAGDIAVRLVTPTGVTALVYVGRTMPSQHAWTTDGPDIHTGLQAALGQTDGWWPIRIEIISDANALAGPLQLQTAPISGGTPGAWTTVPESALSPLGCFEQEVRLETHRDMLKALTDQFGFQWVCEPRTLESGEFPGQIIPRVRAGRDYQVTIDAQTGSELEAQADAGDTIDELIVDAAGINHTDDDQQQLTAKVIDYETAVRHLGLVSDYESLAEITEETMLRQRAGSLLTLRSSPNEQVGVRPVGQRDLQPLTLTGELARMAWRPGDGAVLALDEIGVTDLSPRQITTVTWPFVPDGFGRPQVAFRQRPRGPAVVMRRALRAGIVSQRNDPRVSATSRYRDAVA